MINKDELLFVVDEKNNPAEPQPRHKVHAEGYWHRNSHVWIRDQQGKVLCGQRSMKKDSKPGFWEPFFGGHVLAGESYVATAAKECNEELGLNVAEDDLRLFKIFKIERAKEFIQVYGLLWSGDSATLIYEEDEVAQVQWFDLAELRKLLTPSGDSKWNTFGFEGEILDWLEKI